MIPRLEAEESNLAAERIAVGTGATKAAGDVVKRWARLAAGGPAQAPTPARTPPMFSPEVFARIKVRTVAKGQRNG